jgi:hypothetical protein
MIPPGRRRQKNLDSFRPARVPVLPMRSLTNPTTGFYFWFWFSHARGLGGGAV